VSGPPKTVRLSNVPHALWQRAVGVVAPSLVALLGLGGVTAPPALSIHDARGALEYARTRADEYEREFALAEQYAEQALDERSRNVLRAVRGHMPEQLDIVVAQAAVRLACEGAGFELTALNVGPTCDPLLAPLRDRIVLQTFELVGSGALDATVAVQEELHALGYPNCVLEANVNLDLGARRRADVRLQLGLFHFAPLPPVDDATLNETGSEQP
jgi:hypothetical protein